MKKKRVHTRCITKTKREKIMCCLMHNLYICIMVGTANKQASMMMMVQAVNIFIFLVCVCILYKIPYIIKIYFIYFTFVHTSSFIYNTNNRKFIFSHYVFIGGVRDTQNKIGFLGPEVQRGAENNRIALYAAVC